MLGRISQGLHASIVACAHRLEDIGVGRRQAASTNFNTHLKSLVRYGQATLANDAWPGDIGRGLAVSAVAYALRSADVDRGLCTSAVASAHRSVVVGRGLSASPLACTHPAADVGCCLPTSLALGLHTTVSRHQRRSTVGRINQF